MARAQNTQGGLVTGKRPVVAVVAVSAPADSTAQQADAAGQLEQRIARLEQLGASLAISRREAILYRRSTGIEQEWDDCDEAYEGEDAASKAESKTLHTRMPGQAMPRVEGDVRSTVVLNITKPYVNAFASKIIDMRLQINDRAWAFKPTPIPQLEDDAKTKGHLALVKDGQPIMVTDNGQQRAATVADLAKRDMEKALAASDKAQRRVDDWLTQGRWDSHARQAIDDMARLGTGVLKGPFPEKVIYTSVHNGVLKSTEVIEPRSKRINVRNLFPDPACGENIHSGDYIWEYDEITRKGLRELKNTPELGYIPEQIDKVLDEGPRAADVEYDPKKKVDPAQKSKPFGIWYMTGTLEAEDMEAAGCKCKEGQASVSAIVTMVNDHVIRASLNPLDNGKFSYDVAPCSRREGYWFGTGIARDLRTPQRMITGATRAMMENLGLTAKPMIAMLQGLLVPMDGNTSLYGGKMFIIPAGTDVNEAQKAVFSIQIDSRVEECLKTIQFGLKIAEDVTGLPMILQGQQGAAPDLVGVVQILNENATSVARRVAKMFDDNLLEPHIGGYYTWLMQYGPSEDEKGDYTIDVLTPPDIMADAKALNMMGQLGQNKASRVDPAKMFAEVAKSQRFDPERIQYSEEEWAKIEQQSAPSDPRIAVAQINAESEAKRVAAETASKERIAKLESDTAEVVASINERLKSTQLTSEERQTLAKIKSTLAGKAMDVNAQKEITRDNQLLDLHKHNTGALAHDVIKNPAVEPPGRAENGQAFAQ